MTEKLFTGTLSIKPKDTASFALSGTGTFFPNQNFFYLCVLLLPQNHRKISPAVQIFPVCISVCGSSFAMTTSAAVGLMQ